MLLCAPWATYTDLTEAQAAEGDGDDWDRALLVASEILYALSGRRYRGGGCRTEFTYDADPGQGCIWWTRERPCSHGWTSRIRLPETASTVEAVVLDGAVLDVGGWQVMGPWLWRVGGQGWPPHGGRVVVTYGYGIAPPASGVAAAVELAGQLLLSEQGSDDCRLPERVTSITRQGVTMTALDPMDFLADGRTGLYAVDLFLAAENPGGRAKVPSTVWSPQVAARGTRRPL